MKDAKAKYVEATENSIVYRFLGVIMQAICVAASCTFVETNIYLTVFYVWFGVIGNYLSYRYRNKKPLWLDPMVYLGCLAVAAYCVQDLIADYEMGEYALMRPVVHLLAGILVMHSFELRDRSDIYASLILGLLVLCVSAPNGRSLMFGAGVIVFITLGGVMFFLDARSRNAIAADNSVTTLEEFGPNKNIPPRSGLTGTVFSVALLPLLSIFVFMFVPRGDTYIDKLAAKIGAQFNVSKNNDPLNLPGISKDPIIKKINDKAGHSDKELELPRKPDAKPTQPKPPKEKPPEETTTNVEGNGDQKGSGKKASSKDGVLRPYTHRADDANAKTKAKSPEPADKSKPKSAKDKKAKPADKKKNTKTSAGTPPDKPGEKKAESNKKAAASKKSAAVKKAVASKKPPEQKKSAPAPVAAVVAPKPKERPDYSKATDTGKANGFSDKSMFLVDENFDDKDERLVMTVSCPRTAYIKRMYYDTFDGRLWSASDEGQWQILARTDSGFSNCTDLKQFAIPTGVETIQTDQVYTCGENFGKALSFIGIPQKIDLGPLASFATPTGALFCDNSLPPGFRFSIRASMPLWNLDAMRKAPKETEEIKARIKEGMANYLSAPIEDPMVPALAAEIAGDGNWFSQAENLNTFLRTHYKYNIEKKYYGNIDNYADEFLLRTKSGDCKEFASAFAMLCRSIGIPVRCVSGFTPGTQNMMTGLREIRRNNAHIWCQVYIPSYAWIDFDPVPDGELPSKKAESNYSAQTIAKQVYGENAISPLKILGMVVGSLTLGMLIFYSLVVLRSLRKKKPETKYDPMKAAPSKGIYKKVMNSLKAIDFVKAPHETYHDFATRIAKTQRERALSGQPIYPELSVKLEKFLKLYAEGFFGKVANEDEVEKSGSAVVDHLKTQKLSKRR